MQTEFIFILIAVIVLFTAIVAIRLALRKKKRTDVSKISIRDIDRMEGGEFEDYLAVAFAAAGYETYQTKKSRDYGADLVIVDHDGVKTVIQAKRYGAKLGLGCVQEAYSAQAFYGAGRSMVVTSAEDVTDSCWKLAASTNTSFLFREDVEELANLLRKRRLEEAAWLCASPHIPEEESVKPPLLSVEVGRNRIRAGAYHYK